MALTTACGSGSRSSAPPTSGPTTSVAPGGRTADAGDGVTLEEAGAPPRKPLFLRVSGGTTTSVALVAKIGLGMNLGGRDLPNVAVPATRVVMDQTVDKIDADGTAHSRVSITDVSVVPAPDVKQEVVDQTQALLDQLKGVSGTATVDAHGGNQKVSFDTSSVTDKTLRSTMDSVASQIGNLTAPFPVEPVGIGARWTAKRTAIINGITLNTVTTYTLRGHTGDRYQLDVDQNGTAPTGPVTLPNLPAGTDTSVESYVLHTKGHVNGNLAQTQPENSSSTGEGDAKLTITQGSDRETMTEHLTIDFSLGPA